MSDVREQYLLGKENKEWLLAMTCEGKKIGPLEQESDQFGWSIEQVV